MRALAFAACFLITLAAGSKLLAGESNEARLVRESFNRTNAKLQSGQGTGRITSTNKDGAIVCECDFTFKFQKEKYRVAVTSMKVMKPSPSYDKIDLICDGEAIFATRYSNRIRPSGCQTEVFEMQELAFASNGLPWAPNMLHAAIFDPKAVFAKYDPVMHTNDAGDVVGDYAISDNAVIRFVAPKLYDYHVTKVEGKTTPDGSLLTEYNVSWVRVDNDWRVKSISHVMDSGRVELSITEFEPNTKHLPEIFTLAGLAPCDGSRIIDQRAKNGLTVYKYNATLPQREANLERMSQSLKSLDSKTANTSPAEVTLNDGYGNYRVWITGNVLLVIFLVSLAVYFRRRR